MITRGFLSALVFATFLFSGCSKLDKKEFNKTVIMNFEVDLQPGDPLTLDMMQAFEFATGDLAEFKENIKSYELTSLRYKVWEFWTDEVDEDVLLTGSLGFGNKNSTQPGFSLDLTDVSLLARSLDPNHVEFTLNSSELRKFEQYLLDTNALKVWLNGNVGSTPVHFKFQIIADVKVMTEKE